MTAASSPSIDRRIDDLFARMDDLCTAGDFATIDAELQRTVVGDQPTDLLVGFLVITSAARNRLVERGDFLARVRAELLERESDPARVDRLLWGL